MAGARCQPCAVAGTEVTAQAFCRDCVEFYCNNCSRYHTRFKMAVNHIILTGSAVPTTNASHHLYENVPDVIYDVELTKINSSQSHNLLGKYRLRVGRFGLALIDPVAGSVLYDWSFSQIRRYGLTSNQQFILEVGRRSKSGEATFFFKTTAYKDIHQTVMTRPKAMMDPK